MDLITPEIGLFFWHTVVFLVLLFIMAKFAWKPILGAINEREDSINNALSSAEEARKEMQNLKADNEKLLQEARVERDAILIEAREIKVKVINDAAAEALLKEDMIVVQEQISIQIEKNAYVAEIMTLSTTLTTELVM